MATLQLRQISVPEGQTIDIQDVSWSEFETILQELGENRNTRIAYSEGTLTIVAPMPAHAVEKVCIARYVEVLLDELERDYTSYGSTTSGFRLLRIDLYSFDHFVEIPYPG